MATTVEGKQLHPEIEKLMDSLNLDYTGDDRWRLADLTLLVSRSLTHHCRKIHKLPDVPSFFHRLFSTSSEEPPCYDIEISKGDYVRQINLGALFQEALRDAHNDEQYLRIPHHARQDQIDSMMDCAEWLKMQLPVPVGNVPLLGAFKIFTAMLLNELRQPAINGYHFYVALGNDKVQFFLVDAENSTELIPPTLTAPPKYIAA